MEINDWTLSYLSQAVCDRRLSPVEITNAYLNKIERSAICAFVAVKHEKALMTAKEREAEIMRGIIRGPLHGVPLAHKDIFYVDGVPAACGTAKLDYFAAEQMATAVSALQSAGAITLGKLNMTELAMSPFGENVVHGDVRNPWIPAHCAGGSSSGAAAAVAGGLVPGALGSDTAGSIRQPAAYCGAVGLKPTYGRVSRFGAMPLSWSLDHVGPITRTVRDAALLLSIIAGHDSLDRTSSTMPVDDYLSQISQPISRYRLGIPKNYYWDDLEPGLHLAIQAAISELSALGGLPLDIELPDPRNINSVSSVITRSEGTAIHGAFAEKHPDILSRTINDRLKIGYQISAYDYLQAQRLRGRLAHQFIRDVFSKVDAIITPVAPGIAPRLDDMTSGSTEVILDRMGHVTLFTRPFNGLGLPAISMPCGFSESGLPFAFQLIGRPFDEAFLFRIAHQYEQACAWWSRQPP